MTAEWIYCFAAGCLVCYLGVQAIRGGWLCWALGFVLLATCCNGQEILVPGLDTNANTITVITGQSYNAASPIGAFFIGFGLMLSCLVFGVVIRSMRLIGHSGESGI